MPNQAQARLRDLADLEPIPGSRNRYCGPAAVAAITGLHPDDAANELAVEVSRFRGRRRSGRAVGLTYVVEVHRVLERLGYRVTKKSRKYRAERFRDWANRTLGWRRDRLFLVVAGKHWRVVKGWKTVCGIRRTPCHTNSAAKPGSIVTDVYEITAC